MFADIFLMLLGVGLYKAATRVKQNPGPVKNLARAIKDVLRT
jgi:hypothetical protein